MCSKGSEYAGVLPGWVLPWNPLCSPTRRPSFLSQPQSMSQDKCFQEQLNRTAPEMKECKQRALTAAPHNQIYDINSHRSVERLNSAARRPLEDNRKTLRREKKCLNQGSRCKDGQKMQMRLFSLTTPSPSSTHVSNSTLPIHSTSRLASIPSQNLLSPLGMTS